MSSGELTQGGEANPRETDEANSPNVTHEDAIDRPRDTAARDQGDQRPQPDSSREPVAVPELGSEPREEPSQEQQASAPMARHRERQRGGHANALGMLIEEHFGDASSPCRSYSDLERHSGISREALSRYVTARADRRRSPTIDTLVAVADAMHLSLEAVARAAAASVKGVQLPRDADQQVREEVLGTLVAALSDEQFSAVVELLRQLRPVQTRS